MDNNEIKKALECCASEEYICTQCPIDEKIKDDCECGKVVARNALSLIKSQEQRIKEQCKTAKKLRKQLKKANRGVRIFANRTKQLTENNERLKTRYVSADNLIIAETARKIFGKLESNLRISFINGDEENAMLIIGYDDYDAIKKEMGVNQDE